MAVRAQDSSDVLVLPAQAVGGAPIAAPALLLGQIEGREAAAQAEEAPTTAAAAAPAGDTYGPTPLNDVKILQKWLFGENEKPPINVSGWVDMDYTYRSTGKGENNIAPVQNRFGDEFLCRELGLYLSKPLDPKELSWGFNAILLGGSDAAFLNPTAGWFKNDNPRFGVSFTDLNLTAHLPILTDGGVDIKAGRQTTVLGPMGAIAWQR
jgi:hypothetical protein